MNFSIKPLGRALKAANGFLYNFIRYCRYSGYKADFSNSRMRNYQSVKIYHTLEKSMSFKDRNPSSGWTNAFLLLNICKEANKHENIGYHDEVALSILEKFISFEASKDRPEAIKIRSELRKLDFYSDIDHGSYLFTEKEMKKGVLDAPEDFFMSRYSLREFSQKVVEESIVKKAIWLAMKTPSACNRQPWFVYHITDPKIKKSALGFQSGNRGFGDRIPNLLIITADLNAFIPGQEHYQHWIDGGMFSMSVIYALHSLGVASCCLNWSQTPHLDKELRKEINIQGNHSIMMMLAVGWPDEKNTVCVSPRRPFDEIYISLG